MFGQKTLCFLLVLSTAGFGCHREYEFDQKKVELKTVGHELHQVWVKDAARSAERAPEKVQMLDENYAEFVSGVDTIIPESELNAVDLFLRNLLSLIDEGIVPALVRKIAAIMRFATSDQALLSALATPTGPDTETYISPNTPPDFLGYVTAFPDLPGFMELQGRMIADNDGFDENGVLTFEEPAAISDMLRVLARELAQADPDPNAEPIAGTIRDMLLVEDTRYAPEGPFDPVLVATYDDRGYPQASIVGGEVAEPFVDGNGDGLADIDNAGNFIYSSGGSGLLRPFAEANDPENVNEPGTRDAAGRATGPDGPVFQYIDLQSTGLGFMVRQQKELSEQDAMFDLLQAMQVVLGQKVSYDDDIGGYQGYNVDNPMTDLSHAGVHAIDTPELVDVLEGMGEMSDRKSAALAELFSVFDQIGAILDKYPEAKMNDNETVLYDLLPILREVVSDPALFADVMTALQDPINRKTGEAFATLLEHTDRATIPAEGGPYDACFQTCQTRFEIGTIDRYQCIRGCPMGELFSQKIDYTAPETVESRSAFQSFQHLLYDTTGVTYSMNIAEASFDGDPLPQLPAMLVLPDHSAAFMRSVAGNLDLGEFVPNSLFQSDLGPILDLLGADAGNIASIVSVLSQLFGAQLDVIARPDQITRLFNQQDLKYSDDRIVLDIEDPVGNDGYVLARHLAYGLYQAEAAGVIDTIRPLAKAFSDHDKEHLLTAMMVVLNDHYSGSTELYPTNAGAPSPTKGANFRAHEAALHDIFVNTNLFGALNDFAIAQAEVETETGIPMTEALRAVLQKSLSSGYTNRRGESFVVVNDGSTRNNATPLHHMLNAVDQASARLATEPEKRDKMRDAVGNLLDVMLGAEVDANGNAAFKNRGSIALNAHMMRYMADRVQARRADGTLSTWLKQDLLIELEDLWRSRMMAAMVDFTGNILGNEQDKATIDAFMSYQLGSLEGQNQTLIAVFQILVKSVDTNAWLPIATFLGDVINPDRKWIGEPYTAVPIVSLVGQLLQKTLEADPDNTGIFLIHRGLKRPDRFQDSPFTIILDLIARYFSPDPSKADAFEQASDYKHFLEQTADYLEDDTHGMERLYRVVDQRQR